MSTFGNTNIEASEGFISALIASKFTVAEAGMMTFMVPYIGTFTMSEPLLCAIYANAAGEPGALLATSSEVTIFATGWATAELNYAFTAGTYWLAMWCGGTGSGFAGRYKSPGDVSDQSAYKIATYPTLPDPFNKSSFLDSVYSIYALYTPNSSGNPAFAYAQQQ